MVADTYDELTVRLSKALKRYLDAERTLAQTKNALRHADDRERSLRAQLARTQRQLADMLELFTDDKLGSGWRRTPYLRVEDLNEYRWCAQARPVAPASEPERQLMA